MTPHKQNPETPIMSDTSDNISDKSLHGGGHTPIPSAIAELVLRLGKAEWGQTPAYDADGHAAHVADSVRITADYFDQSGDQHMHGLYLKGTETVLCHTGTSPNSPTIAQAMTGAWNWLYEQCKAEDRP